MAAVSAALAVAIGVLSLPGPQASAGELRDKQKQAQRQVEKADEALEESSSGSGARPERCPGLARSWSRHAPSSATCGPGSRSRSSRTRR